MHTAKESLTLPYSKDYGYGIIIDPRIMGIELLSLVINSKDCISVQAFGLGNVVALGLQT